MWLVFSVYLCVLGVLCVRFSQNDEKGFNTEDTENTEEHGEAPINEEMNFPATRESARLTALRRG